jgi:hypothetical protein
MKRLKGFEPSTFCMASRRSSQLSYSRVEATRYRASGSEVRSVTSRQRTRRANGRERPAVPSPLTTLSEPDITEWTGTA